MKRVKVSLEWEGCLDFLMSPAKPRIFYPPSEEKDRFPYYPLLNPIFSIPSALSGPF